MDQLIQFFAALFQFIGALWNGFLQLTDIFGWPLMILAILIALIPVVAVWGVEYRYKHRFDD